MVSRLKAYLEQQHLLPSGQQVLLAVSGGRDSVCMAHLFTQAGIPFGIAHCNFNLRPGDCDRDEAFVRRLADEAGVPCHVACFDTRTLAAASGESIEEAARRLRYTFFASLCDAQGYACVATAHHRDDAVETFFLNLFRGTGIAGLHGIRPRLATAEWGLPLLVVRPMLGFSRAEISAYMHDHGLAYMDDHTNLETDARRNRIRLQLMPLLRQLYPSVDATMEANIERLAEVEEVYLDRVAALRRQLVQPYASPVPGPHPAVEAVSVDAIEALRPQRTLLFELLRGYGAGAAMVDEIIAALPACAGQLFHTPTHSLTLHRGWLLLAPRAAVAPPAIVQAAAAPADLKKAAAPACIFVDADALTPPLALRQWQPGDRFHPFGMKGSRLVSDFLTDLHLSRLEKPWVHLLLDAEGRVVWVVGLRADERFRVTEATRRVLQISLQN